MSCASSIPERPLHAGYPIENQMPNTGTRKNEPMRPQIYNRTTPREKGGLGGLSACPPRKAQRKGCLLFCAVLICNLEVAQKWTIELKNVLSLRLRFRAFGVR